MAVVSPLDVTRRLRRQVRRAAADLRAYEAEQTDREHFGTFALAAGEPVDGVELKTFIDRARREHPQQHLEITVTATAATPPQPSPE